MSGSGRPGDTRNFFLGRAQYVIQFRDSFGDLHLHIPPAEKPLEKAARRLAEAVYRQWLEEVRVWNLGEHAPLAVPWEADWTYADHREKAGGRVEGGDLASVVAAYRDGGRRLVVLGRPGSGKTTLAVLLTLTLLKDMESDGPRPREAVPVPLSLASWNPDRDSLDAWVARQVRELYPGLPSVEGRHPAAKLWEARRILPVLDGLDEMPEEHRPVAVRHVNRALTGDPFTRAPFLLTCRAGEFSRLVEEGSVITSTPVITARPVEPQAAVEYLRLGTPPGRERAWEWVFHRLENVPGSPVAQALASPLMLWLARTVYAAPRADPDELNDDGRFRTAKDIEEHLLDNLIPAVFTTDPPSPGRPDAPRRWNPDRARRWLGHLAARLDRRHATEIAWWELHRAPIPRLMAFPLLAALGVLTGQALAWTERRFGAERLSDPASTEGFRLLSPSTTLALLFGLAIGTLVQGVAFTWYGRMIATPRRRATPLRFTAAARSAWRGTRGRQAAGALGMCLLPIPMLASLDLPGPGWIALVWATGVLLPAALMILFTAPSTTGESVTPDALFRSERTSVLLKAAVIAPLIGVSAGTQWALRGDGPVAPGITVWLCATIALVVTSAWGRWVLAKLALAGTARLPWSLMGFLRDAHRHGVLRSVGGHYQFRNVNVQKHLAAARRPPSEFSPSALLAETGRDIAAQGADLPGTKLETGPDEVRIENRSRPIRMGSLLVAVVVTPMYLLMNTMQGRTTVLVAWLPVFLLWGIGITVLLAGLAVPRTTRVRINAELIEYTEGRHRVSYRWQDVSRLAMRRAHQFGVPLPALYGLQVQLRADAPPPPRSARGRDGWYSASPILNTTPEPPAHIAEALARFAPSHCLPPGV
ncbi:NACHT domain-containing protein [Actinomadura viridis]|uniref:Membrane protein/energy-coupling factor transporter ATP-binding protein EcfA2 n=1 Tax=Actinomadura viridis TaxID=58110 RepID=A0A931DP18_9ACTN|nr:NACHT domain-containing protein [Actinomadura viridis]MBG6090143.1 putative membrane protein/energy-coupling factor transporter ATP-binding protein EcfA2 [Actinomadura viridis]